jgi:hypothetical protein
MIPRAMLAVAYATGRASYARQVKGDDPDKKEYPGPPVWGFGVGLTNPNSKKLTVTKVDDRSKPTVGCSANGRRRRSGIQKKKEQARPYMQNLYCFVIPICQ